MITNKNSPIWAVFYIYKKTFLIISIKSFTPPSGIFQEVVNRIAE